MNSAVLDSEAALAPLHGGLVLRPEFARLGDEALLAHFSCRRDVWFEPVVDAEETRDEAVAIASRLRSRGIPTEVAPKADKYGRQIRYADRRGIPYVWFGAGSVKDIRSGEQIDADPDTWTPPVDDLRPRVTGA